MASVTFPGVLVAPADDLTDTLALRYADLSVDTSADGEVRSYAGGRRRVIRGRPGLDRTAKVTTPPIARDVLADLEARTGTLQLLRDSKGRALYGTWWKVAVDEVLGTSRVEVSFTFQVTTDTAAV